MGQRCEATVGENEALPSIWIESGPFSFHTELEIKLDPIWRHIYNKNCCNISLFYLHFTIWALSAAHQLANEFFQKVSSWLRVPHSLGALMVHLTARIGRNDSDLFDIYMSICQKKKKVSHLPLPLKKLISKAMSLSPAASRQRTEKITPPRTKYLISAIASLICPCVDIFFFTNSLRYWGRMMVSDQLKGSLSLM